MFIFQCFVDQTDFVKSISFVCVYHVSRIESRVFFLLCLSSSWPMMSAEIVSALKQNPWNGNRLPCSFSESVSCAQNLGLITPHLLSLSVGFVVIPSAVSYQWFYVHQRNHALVFCQSWSSQHCWCPWDLQPGHWKLEERLKCLTVNTCTETVNFSLLGHSLKWPRPACL